jgi:hypothetical protein
MDADDVLFGYDAGHRSISDVLNGAKEYRGSKPHFFSDVLSTSDHEDDDE